MEKDLNERQLDRLVRDWSDDLLGPDIDKQISDSIMDFVENDDTEIDVDELIDSHIHHLAMEESMSRRHKWKIFISSVAAVSAVIFIVASIYLAENDNCARSQKETFTAENQVKEKSGISNSAKPVGIAVSCNQTPTQPNRKKYQAEKAKETKTDSTEQNLIETIAEINAGLADMVDNANEGLNMINVSLLPENLFSDTGHFDGYERIRDEYSPRQHTEKMQNLNIIEANFINVLYEIRNLDIDLNFDNKKTEI